jgi:hypothetical protein
MAHGDKKWIEDYAGRLKRSNDRTWRDKRSDLTRWKWWKKERHACSGCDEINRPYIEHNEMVRKAYKEVEPEYYALFPNVDKDKYELNWDAFKKKYGSDYWNHKTHWLIERTGYMTGHAPFSSDACDACTAKQHAQDQFWNYEKRSKKWYKQTNNRKYRAETNRICRKILMDEEAEDTFVRNRKDVAWWLD